MLHVLTHENVQIVQKKKKTWKIGMKNSAI
jgi:hypothetical protein